MNTDWDGEPRQHHLLGIALFAIHALCTEFVGRWTWLSSLYMHSATSPHKVLSVPHRHNALLLWTIWQCLIEETLRRYLWIFAQVCLECPVVCFLYDTLLQRTCCWLCLLGALFYENETCASLGVFLRSFLFQGVGELPQDTIMTPSISFCIDDHVLYNISRRFHFISFYIWFL